MPLLVERCSLLRLLWLWGPVACYLALIFIVSSRSEVSIPGGVSDLAAHFVAYLGLGAVILRALAGGVRRGVPLGSAVLAAALATLYGASDELHQLFVPGRSASVEDLVADALGAATGAALLWGIMRLRSDA